MYFKVKNPTHRKAKQYLLLSALLTVAVYACTVIHYNGDFSKITIHVATKITELFEEGFSYGIFGLCLFFVPPLFFLWSMGWYWHKRKGWHHRAFVKGIDFQPDRFVLVADEPTILTYAETDFEMIIRIRVIYLGRGQKKLTHQLTLLFRTAGNEGKKGRTFRIEHAAKMEDIFRLADFQPFFHNFTYKFDFDNTAADMNELHKQKHFIREQIQNQIAYGVHLPFRRDLRAEKIALLLFGLFFGGLLLTIIYSLPIVALPLAGVFLYFIGDIIKDLWQFSKADKIISAHRPPKISSTKICGKHIQKP